MARQVKSFMAVLGLMVGAATLGCGGAPAPTGPPVEVSATDLYAAYDGENANSSEADAKYKNRTLIVTGTVKSTITDDAVTVLLVGEPGEPLNLVQCSFPAESKAAVEALEEGQEVTIEGTGRGYLMFVQVRDCKLK